MKKHLLILLLLALSALAQPKKYQSLLWEISGNGLAKKSYLYGSMHVSDKVSYHLSDAFFKHLLASDYVATESDPSTWIDLYDVLNPNLSAASGQPFYSRFYQKPLAKEALYPLFVNDNNMVNNLLSRTNENQKDYQEDTYLDMFIYQTGRKYKKKVIGLEDAKTSMISVLNSENPGEEPKDENVQTLMKVLRDRSFNQAMLDYYREKNLDMLDSLYVLMTPPAYHKALITDRNGVMLKSIDSIIRKGSLFAAVGAAHLPGKRGLIEMLREKGYSVKPVIDAYTHIGQKNKKTIDGYFSKPEFRLYRSSDAMIALPMLTRQIHNGDDVATPDLANGGIINVKRLPLRDYMKKGEGFGPATLDSLFYENIPGNIVSKKFYSDGIASIYDIANTTKTGNFQRYRYYVTPLEVICVSMNGNGSYVKLYENEVFPAVKLKKYSASWETVAPEKGGFSVNVPSYYAMYGNRKSPIPQNIGIQAYDASEKAYYFVTEQTMDDNQTLESTAFELKRIQDEFFSQMGISADPDSGTMYDNSYISRAKLGNRNVALKTIVSGQKYYLLGTVDASADNTRKFFTSFEFRPFIPDTNPEKFSDEDGHFSVYLPKSENEKHFWQIKDQNASVASERKNLFRTKDRQYSFVSSSGKTVDIFAWTYHRYDHVRSMDSLRSSIRKNILDDYNKIADEESATVEELVLPDYELHASQDSPVSTWEKQLKNNRDKRLSKRNAVISEEKETFYPERNLTRIDLVAERPDCAQAVKYAAFVQDGYIWYMRSLLEKGRMKDDFLDQLADSFVSTAQPPYQSLFAKKTATFIADARSENDSIRYSAFDSAHLLRVEKADFSALSDFVSTFEFRPDEIPVQASFIERIGALDDPKVIPFLENSYRKAGVNSMVQLSVIRALAKQKSKKAYEKIAELFEYDLPLSSNGSEIAALFELFGNDSDNSAILYPNVLQYYGVSEYQDPIVRFTKKLIREQKANPKKLKPFRKMLLADARLETKRTLVSKAQKAANAGLDYEPEIETGNLRHYVNLLYAFQNDKAVADWFARISTLGLPEIDYELAALELDSGGRPDESRIASLLENPATGFRTFRLLNDEKQQVPDWNEDEIARALVSYFADADEDSTMEFLAKKQIIIEQKTATVFFFRTVKSPKNTGYGGNIQIESAAFLNGPDGIDPKAWKALPSSNVTSFEDMESEFDVIIDRLMNSEHKRTSFGKQSDARYDPEYEF